MAALSTRESRMIKFGGILVAVYLALFFGLRGVARLESARKDHQLKRQQAQSLNVQLLRHERKVLQLENLKKHSRIELDTLSRATLAAETSAAIQKAAQSCGVKLGPVRESQGSNSSREIAAMQLEGTGPVAAITKLLHALETLGFPLLVDSLQIDPDPRKPGHAKLTLRAVLLDVEQWQKKEKEDRRA